MIASSHGGLQLPVLSRIHPVTGKARLPRMVENGKAKPTIRG